ncbi:HlyD family secretion protein [Caldimonas brevitalea]|uniref:Multidrug transporter n=1 Tax=Caldimonas brevitalea TaxID=413882 RepID=A0A0G3BIY2_9BURK|nr:biotin/lipoyl-binding protein [Caldimonas brevitalea]AKJ29317.1 multidrug transporter [Caldimonas brevitalea]
MELLFLIVYSLCVWLIFFKFKWLPWNITSQVITVTIPLILMAVLILFLNISAPSSGDVRVINYVVQIVPRVTGRVIEVAVEPNQRVKKGAVLFRIDPEPFQLRLQAAQAAVAQSRAKLIGSQANQRSYEEQFKQARSKRLALAAQLELATLRVRQYGDLAATGAGSAFDHEQARTELVSLRSELAALDASATQAQVKMQARTPDGEQDEVARTRAEIAQAEAQRAEAEWDLTQTTVYAPANGTVVNLQLRPGQVASQLVQAPVMTFVEDEQWVIALYRQNEVREVGPGQEAEIALSMYPGRIIKCKVNSVVWATAGGQVPIGGNIPNLPPMPPGQLAVRLQTVDPNVFLAAGARGQGAVYTDYVAFLHVVRKVFLRVQCKLDWLILKLH